MTSDPANPSSIQLVDVKHLLNDAEEQAMQELRDAGFSDREIRICTTGKPMGQYNAYQWYDEHPLLFDEKYRYHTAILQQVPNLRIWLKKGSLSVEDSLSHGYVLGFLQFLAAAPNRAANSISAQNKKISTRPRKTNPTAEDAVNSFLVRPGDPEVSLMIRFQDFIGESCRISDIEVTAVEDSDGNTEAYTFEHRDELVKIDKLTVRGLRNMIDRLSGRAEDAT